ncbi:hypothetical protein B0H10DRAFT_943638 [Mycena sp. CBHHK59/15]|nr:hypothetical protein B0H10DRAFT_943638 [Mycena sp. CBHHK59/15]
MYKAAGRINLLQLFLSFALTLVVPLHFLLLPCFVLCFLHSPFILVDMQMIAFTFLGLAAAAGLASGQSLSCSDAVSHLLAVQNTDSACFAPVGLFDVLFNKNTTDGALEASVDRWLTKFCATGSCSNATLANIATNISAGCGSNFDEVTWAPSRTLCQVYKWTTPSCAR